MTSRFLFFLFMFLGSVSVAMLSICSIYAQDASSQIRIKIYSNVNGETHSIDTIINGTEGQNGWIQEYNFNNRKPDENTATPKQQPAPRSGLADKLHNRNVPAPDATPNPQSNANNPAALGVQLAASENEDDEEGVKIESVLPGSAAQKAGLLAGDLILTIDDNEIYNAADVKNLLSQYSVGDVVALTIMRNGKREQIALTLQEAAPSYQNSTQQAPPSLDDFLNFDSWRNNNALPDDFTQILEEMRRQMEEMMRQFNPSLPTNPDSWNDFTPNATTPKRLNEPVLPTETFDLKVDKLRFSADTDKKQLNLDFTLATAGHLTVRLFDTNGNVIFEEMKPNFSGNYQAVANIKEVAFSGDFFLQVVQNGKTFTKKIVIN